MHGIRFGPLTFNPGHGQGRFHPFTGGDGSPVPVLYGADSIDGALSETIFHEIPPRPDTEEAANALAAVPPDWETAARGLRAVRRQQLGTRVLSVVSPQRDLVLVRLHGHGLPSLGVTREELIASPASAYPDTAKWARALHAHPRRADGLIWVSRQFDDAKALVLFGDRVLQDDLECVTDSLPLDRGRGLEVFRTSAMEAGITLLEL